MNATVFRLWPWGKSFAALNLKPKLSTLVHTLHTALFQTPLGCKSFPTAFYLSLVSQLSFPIAKRKNTEKRPPPLFFMVDDPQSLLILSSVVPSASLPGADFSLASHHGQSHRLLLSRIHPLACLKSDFCSFKHS